jgi:DNA repair exonuclease SbcCD ATPase subunit
MERTDGVLQDCRRRAVSPIREQPSPRSQSPTNIVRGNQLKELQIENEALEQELQQLRLAYRSMDIFSDQKDRQLTEELAQRRTLLEGLLIEIQSETEKIEQNIAKMRDATLKSRTSEEQFELESRYSALCREEKKLQNDRQLKLESKKEQLKMETKKQLAQMNIQKKLIESDIQAFAGAIEHLRASGGDRMAIPLMSHRDIPTSAEREEVMMRLAEVARDVSGLERKCRTLQDFVALRSPERYDRIMVEKRRMPEAIDL